MFKYIFKRLASMKKAKYSLSAFLITVILMMQAVLLPGIGTNSVSAASLPAQIGVDEETEDEYLCEYEEIASDNGAILYADVKRGHIALQNRGSGHIWYSVPNDFLLDDITTGEKRINVYSDILVNYIFSKDEGTSLTLDTAASHSDCVRNGKITSKTVNGGIEFKYYFSSIDTTVPVRYILKDGALEATVCIDKIKYGKEVKVSSIRLLPSFGAGNSTDNGYLFVPDGSGALISFNNQVQTIDGYSGKVYGGEAAEEVESKENTAQTVKMPVFGIKKADDAIIGIITSGDAMSTIIADNGNSSMGYNIVGAQADLHIPSKITLYENDWANKTTIMHLSSTPVKLKNYTVRYTMLDGDKANYVGMAEVYRNYLLNEKGMKRNTSAPAFYLSLYGAADFQKVFLGIPYTTVKPLTTYSQAYEIIGELEEAGIDDISLRLLGWNNSGILNRKLPAKLTPYSKLGGKSEFNKLRDYCDSKDWSLSVDVDFQRFRKSGNGYSKNSDSTKTTYGEPSPQYAFMRSVYVADSKYAPFYMLKPQKLEKISSKLLKTIPQEINNISLSVMGGFIYSDLSDNGVYRSETLSIYDKILKNSVNAGNKLSFDNANAYVFPYADYITDTPMASSGYDIFDFDVPFYQIALHGCVDLTAGTLPYELSDRRIVLKAAELGLNLSYCGMYQDSDILKYTRFNDLYSTSYTLWKNSAVENYKELKPLLEKVGGSLITEHYISDNSMTKTVFDNGVKVYVNYGETENVYDGVSVPALGFVTVG